MVLLPPPILGLVPAALIATCALVPAQGPQVDFNRDVRPILSGNCVLCHGPSASKRKGGPEGSGGLRLDTHEGSRMDLGGYFAVVPGKPEASELYRRVTATDDDRMPPRGEGAGLTPAETAVLRRWIAQGAGYAKHWSLVRPVRPQVPVTRQTAWPENPIDNFIARRHDQAGLTPSAPADRVTLIRRLSFDLTGLPPTTAEVERFVKDSDPAAYTGLVDRLLASPSYGEHQARQWLDLARYADSAGYADDPKRTIWAYRDWVIRAFQRNLPFDRFTIEQIAGDLLPHPTDEQLVATAFHRNTRTNSEGGTDDEEFRTAAVVDRVSTTMAVWMGTTMACAECHDHKYDPVTQKEFYELLAFFNTSQDSDKRDERPTLPIYTDQQRRDRERWKVELVGLEKALTTDTAALRAGAAKWDAAFPRDASWRPVQLARGMSSGTSRVLTDLARVAAIRGVVPRPKALGFTLVPGRHRAVSARYVRISLPGKSKILSLAEVQIFDQSTNLAPRGKAKQSSTAYSGPAHRAIDGNTDGHFDRAKSTTHTATTNDPWWELDLGALRTVDRIVIWNRSDSRSVGKRLEKFRVALLDEARRPVFAQHDLAAPAREVEIRTGGARRATAASIFSSQVGGQRASTFVFAPSQRLEDAVLKVHWKGERDLRLEATADPRFVDYAQVPVDVFAALALKNDARSVAQHKRVRDHYREIAPELQVTRRRRDVIEKKLAGFKALTTVPIMREQTDKRRKTFIHIRGNFLRKGAAVSSGVPAAFHPLRTDGPKDRLALAKWLVSPENPLTARVVVNRFWESTFGRGLVATSEDFGTRGALPSHPELLDWLATEFVASGWNVKGLLKLMVTSSTYRQSSADSAELRRRDPQNRLFTRGPRFRLSAEMIRDQALAVSGLLSRKQFGPPVRPPRPNLGLRAAFGGSTDWNDSTGEDRYRRGLYTLWQRSMPYPSMAVFDAPSREVCTLHRMPTNTPLQALVLLNDPVYVEAAQSLARAIVRDGGITTHARVTFAIRRCLSRPGTAAEVARLESLFDHARDRYRTNLEAAKAMATKPLGPLPDGADVAEFAAWTVVSNVLLNLDEMLVKR